MNALTRGCLGSKRSQRKTSQVCADVRAALSVAAISFAGLLVSKVLPLVLGTTGVGGALAGGIPVVLELIRNMKSRNDKAQIANNDSLLDAIFRRAPQAAQVSEDPRDGVDLLKGLFGPQIAALGISDEALKLLVQSAKRPAA